MHPSFRVAHKPLISFIGKRKWPPGDFYRLVPVSLFLFNIFFAGPQPQLPHPAAPAEFKEAFPNFLEKYKNFSLSSTNSSNGKSSGKPIFNEFWEAPEYLWQPKIRNLEESEIDAVLVSIMALIPGLIITVHHTERRCVLAVRSKRWQGHNTTGQRGFRQQPSELLIQNVDGIQYNQSFSAYADRCSSSSLSSNFRHSPRVSSASSSLLDTIPISTSPALKSVA